jgi:hypothetical protein
MRDLREDVEHLHRDIKRRLADDDTLGPVNRRDLGEVLDRLRSMLDVRRASSSLAPETADALWCHHCNAPVERGMPWGKWCPRCETAAYVGAAPAPRPEETRQHNPQHEEG